MEPDFWRARWSEGRIAFHEGRPNTHLVKHVGVLGAAKRVLVPLCGKAEDLSWLSGQGLEVVGVELVPAAVRAFFTEHGRFPKVTERGELTEFRSGVLTLFAGDFFAVTRELVGPVDALYDRAALIALPPELRAKYVAHVKTLLPKGAPGLLISVEYPPGATEGPPFSVAESEVRGHYAVELLNTVKAGGPRFQTVDAVEKVYRVTV